MSFQQFSIFTQVLATVGTAAAFWTFWQTSLIWLFPTLVIWGCCDAAAGPAMESLFADSLPDGQRTQIYAWKHATILVASSFSPLISIILFHVYGNNWEICTFCIPF
jgi:MFS family permease